jgi:hypothetical protein
LAQPLAKPSSSKRRTLFPERFVKPERSERSGDFSCRLRRNAGDKTVEKNYYFSACRKSSFFSKNKQSTGKEKQFTGQSEIQIQL